MGHVTPETLDGHTDLSGQCLIAMPGMADPRFMHSVVYLCAHSAEGAMGIILNKPAPEIVLSDLLEQLDLPHRPDHAHQDLYFGGPVETGRGFVLHSPDYRSPVTTLEVSESLHLSTTLDVLEEIGEGRGPAQFLVALGYSGWGPGQLEGEIAQNGWLMSPADNALVFDVPYGQKWEKALDRIGVPAISLSSAAGRA